MTTSDAQALFKQAVALGESGQHEASARAYREVLQHDQGIPAAWLNLGYELAALGHHREACQVYDEATLKYPRDINIWFSRASCLIALERREDALDSLDKALAIDPGHAPSLVNRGAVLARLRRYSEAISSLEAALRNEPEHVEALVNYGVLLADCGRHWEAIDGLERALSLAPGHAIAHWNLALCYLRMGDHARGWREHEWRWQATHLRAHVRLFAQPLWLGAPSLAGKSILLHAEQGLGDTLQFYRFVPLIAQMGASVTVQVPQVLSALVSRQLAGLASVIATDVPLPLFDFHCPFMSLPLALGISVDTIPAPLPYTGSPPHLREKWQKLLGEKSKPRIAIAWKGSKAHANDWNRSIPLPKLTELFHGGYDWVSLQWETDKEDAEALEISSNLRQFNDNIADFTDTAAIVELCDLVISVDSSMAHLAGTVGTPAWILLPFSADWRWMTDRQDSPWYPGARLFRQPSAGDWTSVIHNLSTALALQAREGSSGNTSPATQLPAKRTRLITIGIFLALVAVLSVLVLYMTR